MKTLAISLASCIASSAVAQTFNFQFLPTSTAQQSALISFPLVRTFIGDYDAKTNPAGTRTLPGLFGGSGNQAIPYTSTLQTSEAIDSHPSGSFILNIDADGICRITNYFSDLLNGTPGTVTVDMLFSYSSFHTVAPNALFPSVGSVTIPIASGAVKVATATQSGPAVGALIETAPNTYTISIPVPVTLVVSGSAGGQPFGIDPTPAVLAFAGTLTVNGSTATFTSSASTTQPLGPIPAPPPLVNEPLAVPTVIPTGSTANLLLSGTFSDGNGTSTFNTIVNASGSLAPIPGDLNADGTVGGADLAILLSAWGTNNPVADINHDGLVDGLDLATLLSGWTSS